MNKKNEDNKKKREREIAWCMTNQQWNSYLRAAIVRKLKREDEEYN